MLRDGALTCLPNQRTFDAPPQHERERGKLECFSNFQHKFCRFLFRSNCAGDNDKVFPDPVRAEEARKRNDRVERSPTRRLEAYTDLSAFIALVKESKRCIISFLFIYISWLMHALEIHQLRKTYSNGIEALKGIDLTVNKGDFFALLGANGAGKSTCIGLIATLLTKTAGTIKINGFDIDKQTEQAKSCLGLVPQEFNLNIFEQCEQILLGQAGFYGISRKEALPRAHLLLKQLGLWQKRHAMVRHLSGGMKRRLMIARAMIHQPEVLILDEPTAGVDIEIRRSMWDFLTDINSKGTTIILTTHYLEEAEQLCKNIAIIHQGEIIENTSMKELLQTLKHQTYVFNTIDPVTPLPSLSEFKITPIDKTTFECRVDNQMSLNEVFAILSKHHISIHSMRNKTNRLEELFMDLINHGH